MILHRRQAGQADYIFLVNDAREPGDYVGQYGRVMELGLPTSAEVRLERTPGAVYDLLTHREVAFQETEVGTVIPVTLGPCEGRVLMAVPQPIDRVLVDGDDSARRGGTWKGQVVAQDKQGKPIEAVIPLHVDVLDPDGRSAEFSGYYGAAGGKLELNLDIATNDRPGIWEVRVHDLASGQSRTAFVRVTP